MLLLINLVDTRERTPRLSRRLKLVSTINIFVNKADELATEGAKADRLGIFE